MNRLSLERVETWLEALEERSVHSPLVYYTPTEAQRSLFADLWQKAAQLTLDVARDFPDVEIVNLGGGYKIDRMEPERSICFQTAFQPVKEAFDAFAAETGRRLHLEIEPGTFLVANGCCLVARINDIVDTGRNGYRFVKLNVWGSSPHTRS